MQGKRKESKLILASQTSRSHFRATLANHSRIDVISIRPERVVSGLPESEEASEGELSGKEVERAIEGVCWQQRRRRQEWDN